MNNLLSEQFRQDHEYTEQAKEMYYQQYPEKRPVPQPVITPWYKWILAQWRMFWWGSDDSQ